MKILFISGFLGSGKTTFIREFSKHLEDVVILENEVARDVDHELLSSEGQRTYSIDEGCACCTNADQFENSIITISAQLHPEYLIVEPTGIAKLSSIIQRIKRVEYERIEYLGSIAILELLTYHEVRDQYSDLFEDTLRNSDFILFSKSENQSPALFKTSIDQLSLHTKAECINQHYSEFTNEQWKKIANPKFNGNIEEVEGHLHIRSLSFDQVHFNHQEEMSTVFNALMSGRFGRILRAKGGFSVGEESYRLDIVRDKITIKASQESLSQLVFIGERLEEKAFDTLFQATYTKNNK